MFMRTSSIFGPILMIPPICFAQVTLFNVHTTTAYAAWAARRRTGSLYGASSILVAEVLRWICVRNSGKFYQDTKKLAICRQILESALQV